MRNYHQDYFYLHATGRNTPRLSFDKNQVRDTHLLFQECPITEDHVITMKFGSPIPPKPELGDVLKKLQHSVVSDRLKALLKEMKLKGVQYLPSEIRNPNTDDVYTDYWVLHIHNLIYCLNREESKFDMSNGSVASIEKLVFDHEVLDKVPLEERLVFALGEQSLYTFFHRSVAEKIASLQPQNVQFTSLGFEDEATDPLPELLLPYVYYPVRKVYEEEDEDLEDRKSVV